ncbi:MAG: aminotransferase class V-fold PLP-dependent enzyme [Bacteroidia bacterium]|nr:aminotransferase class V-fold PLP-dependent enzyme [Bacteroidia bacterium]
MSDRREFVKKVLAGAGAFAATGWLNESFAGKMAPQLNRIISLSPQAAASDEAFWELVRNSFTVSKEIINLNNGGVSPQPRPVQEAHIRNYQYCNEGPSYYMWRMLDKSREPLRKKLAELGGCDPEEVAINRNSTEGLNSIIFGLNLKPGDEVVLCKYDYPNMMNAWRQREKRDGIKLVWVDLELPFEFDKAAHAAYVRAMTPKTKVVHITHMINWCGQMMPVKAIAEHAHSIGAEVIVDGAHTFAHIEHKIPELGCDYYATSLHKWLCAPFGSGLMWIKKNKIQNVWALLSNDKPDSNDIRKFESLGTRSFASEMAILSAIEFHETIGGKRKEERLRYLKDYWTQKVIKFPKVRMNTSLQPGWSCAIANVSVEGWDAVDMEQTLFERHKIHTVAIKHEKLNGLRVTPHLYTSLGDLDKLIEGLEYISKTPSPGKK